MRTDAGLLCFVTSALLTLAAHARTPIVPGFDRVVGESVDEQETAGRLLLGELSCTACHVTQSEGLHPKRGPKLDGVADRLRASWMHQYLADPTAVMPGTTMPDLLAGMDSEDRATVIETLVAYLSSLHDPSQFDFTSTAAAPRVPEFWNYGDRLRGARLYHRVGCVACHEPDREYQTEKHNVSDRDRLARLELDPGELKELGLAGSTRAVRSVPLTKLAVKYDRRSLTFFLLDPLRTRPSGRMPNMKLHPEEAADIAAHLIHADSPSMSGANPESELVARGRRLFTEVGCVNCHQATGSIAKPPSKRLVGLEPTALRSCIGDARLGLPNYVLDEQQRQAVMSALAAMGKTPVESDRSETADWSLLKFNCYACHQRGQQGGVGTRRQPYFVTSGHIDLGDEGRLPPSLDGVGNKFKTAWLKQILDGEGDVRAHMLARMPVFGAENVGRLADQLATADRKVRPAGRVVVDHLADEPAAGRALLDAGCVQCHPLRGEALPGVMGIDLADVNRRLEPQWFHDFLLNPAALKRRTRMPTFFAAGRSPTPDILDGDVSRQIAAMWSYLNDIQNQRLPPKIEQGKVYNFELVPRERPIVLRTFMESAGTHAIAAGFPQKVHWAFDAENVRLVQAWRGRFLDAHGTWFDRFTPLARPLGDDVVLFPSGMPFAKLAGPQAPWPAELSEAAGYRFRGYRLDTDGTPTLLYQFAEFAIEDRLVPENAGQGIRRQLRLEASTPKHVAPAPVWFRAAAAERLTRVDPQRIQVDARLSVSVSAEAARLSRVRRVADLDEWVVPLDVEGAMVFEVRYRW